MNVVLRLDPFDPNDVLESSADARIWLNERDFALVDPADALYLTCYRWSLHRNARGAPYASRLVGAWPLVKRQRIFMHREIMKRVGPPPTEEHRYVDHKNGDTLDNRRANLRWATAEMNARNTWANRLVHGIPE